MAWEISCFISPHGFGHATRTIAVLEALHELLPDLQARIFTTVPEALFRSGCRFPITYHHLITDIGFVQDTAFTIDGEATLDQLRSFLPLSDETVTVCASLCRKSSLILCDISPIGIMAGKRAGIPSLLLENFTWDWIYQHYTGVPGAFHEFGVLFAEYYRMADHHLQTEPVCQPQANLPTCPPIARKLKGAGRRIIDDLIGRNRRPVVLISAGGLPFSPLFVPHLQEKYSEISFIVAGQSQELHHDANICFLPATTSIDHPDLIDGADLLVCKCGYSTIAECAQTDTPLCCINRSDFAESPVLASYATEQLNGTIVSQERFLDGSWLNELPHMLSSPKRCPRENGNLQAARIVRAVLC